MPHGVCGGKGFDFGHAGGEQGGVVAEPGADVLLAGDEAGLQGAGEQDGGDDEALGAYLAGEGGGHVQAHRQAWQAVVVVGVGAG